MNSDSSDYFKKNIDIMIGRYPGFRSDVIEKYSPSSRMETISAGEGLITARIDGNWIHSSKNPRREAARLVQIGISGNGVCIIYGFGLGYHIEALRNLYPDLSILVIEPDPSLFLEALGFRDFTGILGAESIGFAFDIKPSNLSGVLAAYKSTAFHTLKLRSLYNLDSEYYSEIDNEISAFMAKKETNMNTLNRFGRAWIRNLFGNLEVFRTAGDTGLWYNRFSDVPAFVIAAGPSLDQVLPLLPEISRRFLIICVDTALRAVLSSGVIPDFLFIVDPQYLNTRHLDNCFGRDVPVPAAAEKHSVDRPPVLISESSTHPSVFRKCTWPVFFFKSIFPLGKMIESSTGIVSELGAGGSVATTAWDFARRLGCPEIYTAGLDLGFPGENTHCRNSLSRILTCLLSGRKQPMETINFNSVRNAEPFPVKNNSGAETLTDKRLIIYKWWFEGQLKQSPGAPVFNTSPEGIRIEGFEYRAATRLLEKKALRTLIDDRIISILGNFSIFPEKEFSGMVRIIESIIAECGRLEDLCTEALLLTDRLGGLHSVSIKAESAEIFDRLSVIDKLILESPSKELTSFIIQPVLNEIIDSKENVLEKSFKLYDNILEACRFHRVQAEHALTRITADYTDG